MPGRERPKVEEVEGRLSEEGKGLQHEKHVTQRLARRRTAYKDQNQGYMHGEREDEGRGHSIRKGGCPRVRAR